MLNICSEYVSPFFTVLHVYIYNSQYKYNIKNHTPSTNFISPLYIRDKKSAKYVS